MGISTIKQWNPPLCVGKPLPVDEEAFFRSARRVFASGRFANNGPEVDKLEARMAELSGKRDAVAVCNATLGLELCLRSLADHGTWVAVPTWTFPAAPQAICAASMKPLFQDVADITPESTMFHQPAVPIQESGRRRSIGAFMGFLAWGRTNGAAKWVERSLKSYSPIIFDAAHALGCAGVKRVGGDAHVYSLHCTKQTSGFEGGVVCTDNLALAKDIRRRRNFGYSLDAESEIRKQGYPDLVQRGTNAKMHELSAAMANLSLEHLDDTIGAYKARYFWYEDALQDCANIKLLPYPDGHNYQYIVLHWTGQTPLDRVCRRLYERGVCARRYFAPGCHRMPTFWGFASDYYHPTFEGANFMSDHTLVVPTGPQMSQDDVGILCEMLRKMSEEECVSV